MSAIQGAFDKCLINGTGGDPTKLLYDSSSISCSDNINLGRDRVQQALQLTSMATFFAQVGLVDRGRAACTLNMGSASSA